MTEVKLVVGIDVGSTTVKSVVVDPSSRALLWSTYQRHETKQAQMVAQQLEAIERAFPDVPHSATRLFATGSGAPQLCQPLGASFIQEVNAVVTAVDTWHRDVGSVIELGGQDAKIVIYKFAPVTGKRHADATMNDRCAAGTGATIDKCLLKTGISSSEAAAIAWDGSRLHHVAAKCGVFAETDIVNLLKCGIPTDEIMCSLADAIVTQNLSVLTRGSMLPHKVLLLGGPNLYLPFLRDCWRARIPETWVTRAHPFPADVPIADLIYVPDNAHLHAAYGAAIYGLGRNVEDGRYRGTADLHSFIDHGRREHLGARAGPPLVKNATERDAFVARYTVPPFTPYIPQAGATVTGYIGIDGGSTSSKAVLLDADSRVLCKAYMLSAGNPIDDVKVLLQQIEAHVSKRGATLKVLGAGVTGYAAKVLEETLCADSNIVETVAHMEAATLFFDDVDVICDVGGQDIKVLFIVNGQIRDFRLSHQCSAGNGMLLQAMANQFGIAVDDYAMHAFRADFSPNFSYGCAVFLDTDRINFQKEGYAREELLAGLARVLPKNIWQYVVQIPRMAALGKSFVLQGGTQYNLAALKAQHDYIVERVPDARIHLHPHPGEAGAIGAALEAMRVVAKRGNSRFIGIQNAVNLHYVTKNDSTTACGFCKNECRRTFIDTMTPDGRTSRYISGFSCERGTVESIEDLKRVSRYRSRLRSTNPNLVDYECKLAFRRFFEPAHLPATGTLVNRERASGLILRGLRMRLSQRRFERSSAAQQRRRAKLRVGIPRSLGVYATAPMWRAFFETLGLRPANIVFSDYTSEELWTQGARYGSVDPCFPAKVAQAHIHNLLAVKHRKEKLNYIFFPGITHMPNHLVGTIDSATCPIVAGTPVVMRAAFTKELDFFAKAGVEFVCPALTLLERNYFKKQIYEAWGERLGATRDEIEFACDQGFEALRQFDAEMERRGLDVLERLHAEHRVGVLLLGRPYHGDPGMNHNVLDDLQACGFPILSIRSIPKEGQWIERFFADGSAMSAHTVADVWPENYSTNSVQKVWAAKFAARHPNVAVVDMSSFKCGLDAPIYSLITNIINASATPYCALHDLDANKPAGSLKIRIDTFAYTLRRYEQALAEHAAKLDALKTLINAKRRELLRERQRHVLKLLLHGSGSDRRPLDLDAIYADYLDGAMDDCLHHDGLTPLDMAAVPQGLRLR
jgi:activator of 2-hydroxyglutaryl-CoA dehydratase/predicted nucleotide-binding protein (sugar kinase/HSP70/actin superfamily)